MIPYKMEEQDTSDICYRYIEQVAWYYSNVTKVPQEELESEGLLEYVLCLTKYDPNRHTKFTTFFYSCLLNHFKDYSMTWYKQLPAMLWEPIKTYDGEEVPLPEIACDDMTDRIYSFRQMLSKLSPPAQGVALILEECADEIVSNVDAQTVKNPHSPKHLKGALRRFLLKLGWKENVIDKAFTELTMAVQTM